MVIANCSNSSVDMSFTPGECAPPIITVTRPSLSRSFAACSGNTLQRKRSRCGVHNVKVLGFTCQVSSVRSQVLGLNLKSSIYQFTSVTTLNVIM